MATETELVNVALRKGGGAKRILSLTDTVGSAGIAADVLAQERDDLLREGVWNFAVTRVSLAQLSARPGFGFAYAYALPSDFQRVISVHDNDTGGGAVPYKIEAIALPGGSYVNSILSNASAIYLRYVRTVTDPNLMSSGFRQVLILRMAKIFALNLAKSNTLYQTLKAEEDIEFRRAKSTDGIENYPEPLPEGSWQSRRRAWGSSSFDASSGGSSGGSSPAPPAVATATATAANFLQSGAGAVTRTVQSKESDIVSVKDFGAVGDNATDDATALQAFFTWLVGATASSPRAGMMPAGIYLTSQALTLNGSYFTLEPVGPGPVVIRYTGAATTVDIVTVGNASTQSARVRIGSIYIDSNTTMTAGAAAHLRNVIESEVHFSAAGQARFGAAGNKLWNGIWWDCTDNCVWGGREIFAQQDGLRVNGTVGVGAKADLTIREGAKISRCAVGVHVGGAFGGFYFNAGNVIGNTVNFRVSNDIAAEGNREIFVGPSVAFDSASGGPNVQLADTMSSASGWIAFSGTWVASSAAGYDSVSIETDHAGIVSFTGGTIYNGGRDGLRNNSTASIILLENVAVRENTAYGVNNTVVNGNIYGRNCYFTSNPSGHTNDPKLSALFTGVNGETFLGTIGQRFSASGLNTPRLSVAGFADYAGGASLQGWVASTRGASLQMLKSRSATPGTFSIVSSGDEIGRIVFAGDDGTQFGRAAQIRALVDGTPGSGDMPGSLYFDVSADGAISPVEALRIDNKRNVVVGAAVGAALATTATSGFFHIPTCAGAPTGVPATTYTGCLPMIYDTTNHKFWIYDSGWKGVVLA